MSDTTSIQGLGERIEQLVQQHIEASRRAAQLAVERAFTRAAASKGPGPAKKQARPRTKPAIERRRTPDEIAALGERFYQALCAKPGETMSVLAADVGATAGELNRPITQLKRAGRVRSAGARNHTRYFPMASEQVAAS